MKNKNSYLFNLKLFIVLSSISLTIGYLQFQNLLKQKTLTAPPLQKPLQKPLVLSVYNRTQKVPSSFQKDVLGESSKISFESKISANIGVAARFTIFGYTSSNASVFLEDIGIKEKTRADKNGFFVFSNLKIPKEGKITPCLFSQDNFGRTSPPVCLPPVQNQSSAIGPVLLPPTLSVSKSFFFAGDKIIISGQTIPNTPVNLNFFKEKDLPELSLALVKPALALNKKAVETLSDEKGNFTFVLQTSDAQKMKIISNAVFNNSPSPQSTRLTIKIYPWWMMIILFFKAWVETLKEYLLEILLLFELVIVLYLAYKKLFTPSEITKSRAIVKYRPLLPVKISSQELVAGS